jgi:hypothetical protein
MRRLIAALTVLALAAPIQARTPSAKNVYHVFPTARPDITVPYLTTGRSTLGVWQKVEPIVYRRQGVGDPPAPQTLPAYNLIFYGSKLGASNGIIAATPRLPNNLRGR